MSHVDGDQQDARLHVSEAWLVRTSASHPEGRANLWMPFFRPDRKIIAGLTNPADARQPLPMIASRVLDLEGILNLTSSVLIGIVSEMSLRSDIRKLLAVTYDFHYHGTHSTPNWLIIPAPRSRYSQR